MNKTIYEIELNTSNICGAECIICSRPHGCGNSFFMKWDVFNTLLEQLKDVDFTMIQTSGNGETFLNPNYLDYIKKLKDTFPDKVRWTYNNFSMLDKEKADRIVEEDLFDRIHVRLESLDRTVFEKNSNLNMDNVFDNLKYFLSINKKIPVVILYNDIRKYYAKCQRVLGMRPARDIYTDEELSKLKCEEGEIINYFQKDNSSPLSITSISHCLWGERLKAPKDTETACPKLDIIKTVTWICPNGDVQVCCYVEDTEVFTDEGWKFFKDLTGKETILTRKANKETEWSKITDTQRYEFEGDLYEIKNRNIDLQVTPEHKFPLEPKASYESNFANKPKELKDGYVWKEIQNFKKGNYFIPRFFDWDGDEELTKKYSIDFLALLGWYLSEGYHYNNKSVDKRVRKDGSINGNVRDRWSVGISQSPEKKPAFYEEIGVLIKKCGFHPIKDGSSWKFNDKKFYDYVDQFGKSFDKFIPNDIKQLPKRHLEALLGTLIKGDGTSYKTGHRYYTVSKQLADDVQEIAYKCGYGANIVLQEPRQNPFDKTKMNLPQWIVTIFKEERNSIKINSLIDNGIKQVHYDGFVYDITVEKNHTLWVRRNGKAVWSSNCYADHQDEMTCGNIMDEHILDIFNGEKRRELIKRIENRDITDYPCTNPKCCGFHEGKENTSVRHQK
ncbi:MAG: radical SAM protein [Candidatus Scalindua sp.]|jgi:intein/homing endonuclease|nr:radical SAM protein [Candidatus Scalindua sp.]